MEKTFDSNLKNKCISYCLKELPLGILSFSSYVDIKAINIISSHVTIYEYKLLNVKSKIYDTFLLTKLKHSPSTKKCCC